MSGPLTHRPFAGLAELAGIDETRFHRGQTLWSQFLGRQSDCQQHFDGVPHSPCWVWTTEEPPRAPGSAGITLTITSVNHQAGTVALTTKGTDE